MPKFFVKSENIIDNTVQILGKDVNHIANVLRMKVDDRLIIGNIENGDNFLCQIINLEDKVTCRIIEKLPSQAEPNISLTIIQGLPKADKMEYIIQKAVELGVTNIIPLRMEHCVVRLNQKEAEKKQIRWQAIAESAAKQCKRDKVPKIEQVQTVKQMAERIGQYDKVLIAYEKEEQAKLKEKLEKLKQSKKEQFKIAVIIGPEGGIAQDEIALLIQKGAEPIYLGKRILRTETASLVISSILMYELGDIG